MKGFALLGGGLFAPHIPAFAELLKHGRLPVLKAVYSRSESSALAISKVASTALKLEGSKQPTIYHDASQDQNLDALLARDDIDAVIVVLPITTQPEVILKALKANKHVLSEKPVAPTVEAGLQLIKTYEEEFKPKGLVWSIAENFECETAFRFVRSSIHDHKIGKVAFFTVKVVNYIDENSKWYKTPWRTVPEYQGMLNILVDNRLIFFGLTGIQHTLAALRVMLSADITGVSAFASLNKDILKPHDTIQAIVQVPNAHGSIDMTFASPTTSKPTFDMFVFTGSNGWISVGQVTLPESQQSVWRVTTFPHVGVQTEVDEFFARVAGNDSGWGSPKAALRDVAFFQAALNSNGTLVDLETLLREEM
ncbi:hypothetical protein DL96DRAFT_1578136, partial [Flagelloscypha sp. PMI_526]